MYILYIKKEKNSILLCHKFSKVTQRTSKEVLSKNVNKEYFDMLIFF